MKYRAYDNDKEEMAYDLIDHSIYLRQDGILIQLRASKVGEDFHFYEKQCINLILNRWSGRKDINGIDIYQNDIVKFPQGKKILIGTMIWNEKKCAFEIKVLLGLGVDDKDKKAYTLANKKMEIIGNVYQDAHFIGKKTENIVDD